MDSQVLGFCLPSISTCPSLLPLGLLAMPTSTEVCYIVASVPCATCTCIILSVYRYMTIVNGLAEESMQAAVNEVCHLPNYSTIGEVCNILLMWHLHIYLVGHH